MTYSHSNSWQLAITIEQPLYAPIGKRNLRLPLEHLSGELELLDGLDNNLLDLASIQSLLNLSDILSSLDDAQAVVGQRSGGLAIDGVGGDLFKSLEGIVVEADELRAGVGVDGQAVEAGGLWRGN